VGGRVRRKRRARAASPPANRLGALLPPPPFLPAAIHEPRGACSTESQGMTRAGGAKMHQKKQRKYPHYAFGDSVPLAVDLRQHDLQRG
jgi:hypothetical protein